MDNVMVDLETLGTSADAPIICIGAVFFDLKDGMIGEKFKASIHIQTELDAGAKPDGQTIAWWLTQSDEARAALIDKPLPADIALLSFSRWIRDRTDRDDVKMWGNGAAFDNPILAQAYRRHGIEAPWQFWNDRCYRTIRCLAPQVQIVREGTYHSALDDAISQAKHLIAINRVLGEVMK